MTSVTETVTSARPDRPAPNQPRAPLSFACREADFCASSVTECSRAQGHGDPKRLATTYTVARVIRSIVFDFDGLILDTEEPVYRSWVEVYEAHGETLPFERCVQIVGSTTTEFHPQRHLEERLGRPLSQDVLDERVARRTGMILAQQVLPGILQCIEDA